jgi:ketosteroid isomerase-like protein
MNMEKTEIINDWLDAWNDHDLERIMQHYADNVEFTAQTVVTRWDKADGTLKGKEALRKHFAKGLALAPDIHFTLEEILFAPNGYAVLYHRDNGNRVLDAVELDDSGLAIKVTAYYLHQQS